jgi:hypothetical protein
MVTVWSFLGIAHLPDYNQGQEGQGMFRFSIRDVLWLTVVVALGVGWWVDHSSLGKRLGEATEDAKTLARLANPRKRLRGAQYFTLAEMLEKYGVEPPQVVPQLIPPHSTK